MQALPPLSGAPSVVPISSPAGDDETPAHEAGSLDPPIHATASTEDGKSDN